MKNNIELVYKDTIGSKPRRVMYVDGEMPFDEIRQRDAALTEADTDDR